MSDRLYSITELIMRIVAKDKNGIATGGRQISNLRYADDTAATLQPLLDRAADTSYQFGLHLYVKKTKVMMTDKHLTTANITF